MSKEERLLKMINQKQVEINTSNYTQEELEEIKLSLNTKNE